VNSSVNSVTAVSLSLRKPSHFRMPDFQNGTASITVALAAPNQELQPIRPR
jgi:hypothetical protein